MAALLEYAPSTRSTAEEELLARLQQRLADIDIASLGPLDAVADKMIASMPEAGASWSQVIGPVYSSAGLQRWLGITRQAISQHVASNRILRLTTADDVHVFPAFQFSAAGARLPHLKDILEILATGIPDPWTWATWLNAPDADRVTNAERMRLGNWQFVAQLALADSGAWSQP